jgi:hypothetical protein
VRPTRCCTQQDHHFRNRTTTIKVADHTTERGAERLLLDQDSRDRNPSGSKHDTAMDRWLDVHGDDIDLLEVRKEG